MQAAKRTPVDLEDWAVQLMEKHNRKSHLAPELSPSTRSLLKGANVASPSRESAASTASTAKTPLSTPREIPTASENHLPPNTSTSEPPMSSRIIDVNGAGGYPDQPPLYDTPNYPPRTSSSMSQSSNRSRPRANDDHYASHSTESSGVNKTLPLRPAPPTGPLPPRPDSTYSQSTAPHSSSNERPLYHFTDA